MHSTCSLRLTEELRGGRKAWFSVNSNHLSLRWASVLQDYSLKGKYETATDVTFSQQTEIYYFTKKGKVWALIREPIWGRAEEEMQCMLGLSGGWGEYYSSCPCHRGCASRYMGTEGCSRTPLKRACICFKQIRYRWKLQWSADMSQNMAGLAHL